MQVIFNNAIIPEAQATVSALSQGALYGYNAFETLLLKGKRIAFFQEHWDRLSIACSALNIVFDDKSAARTAALILQLAEANALDHGVIRMSVARNGDASDFLITVTPPRYTLETLRAGFKVCIASEQINPQSPLSGYKQGNYLVNILTLQKAKAAGYDEALMLTPQGGLAEGSVSNLFLVQAGVLYTPSLACGILPGIVRQQVIQLAQAHGIPVEEGEYPQSLIDECDEMFLTNSLVEIVPVREIEMRKWDPKECPITQRLQALWC